MSVDTIKSELAKLSRQQKVEMMHFLIDEVGTGQDELELTDELKAELNRREAAIKSGAAKLYTWTEVKANLQQRKSQG